MKSTKNLVIASLFAALVCVTTMAIKIPTPTNGYIHPGDGMVLLCGILLGPQIGGLAAGIGSMLADVFSGYALYAAGTLVIKAAAAMTAGILYRVLPGKSRARIAISGFVGESIMVGGYYLYEIGLAMASGSNLAASAIAATAGVPFNVVQGAFGILIALVLFPVLQKVSSFRARMEKRT